MIFALDFQDDRKSSDRWPATAHIYLSSYGTRKLWGNDKAECVCSPSLVSEIELDAEIDRMIKDLERLRRLGKRNFAIERRRVAQNTRAEGRA